VFNRANSEKPLKAFRPPRKCAIGYDLVDIAIGYKLNPGVRCGITLFVHELVSVSPYEFLKFPSHDFRDLYSTLETFGVFGWRDFGSKLACRRRCAGGRDETPYTTPYRL
jgi:hypothetical protein